MACKNQFTRSSSVRIFFTFGVFPPRESHLSAIIVCCRNDITRSFFQYTFIHYRVLLYLSPTDEFRPFKRWIIVFVSTFFFVRLLDGVISANCCYCYYYYHDLLFIGLFAVVQTVEALYVRFYLFVWTNTVVTMGSCTRNYERAYRMKNFNDICDSYSRKSSQLVDFRDLIP